MKKLEYCSWCKQTYVYVVKRGRYTVATEHKLMVISRFDLSLAQAHWVESNQSTELCY